MTKQVLSLLIALLIMPGTWLRDGLASAPSSLANTSQSQEVLIEGVLIRGNRRIPEPTIKIWIGTREGDPYNPIQLDRDVRALNAQGHFDDVKVFAEDGTRAGKIITFELRERPLLLDIKYEGLKSIQQSTLLEEFRKRQVGLSKESQYDPVKAKRAAAVIKEMLANEGRPEAKVDPAVEEISATAVALTFKIDEGPRFRVADVEFEGNTVYSDSDLRSKMKLVKKVGLFTTFSSKDIYHKEKLQADLDRLRVLVYADNGYLKARFGEPRVEEVGKVGTWVPLVGHKGQGLKIVIPIDEGRQYKAGEVRVEDNTEFTADQIKAILDIKAGDVVRGYSVVNKGIENLKKLYGSRGYIQFEAGYVPDFKDTAGDTTTGIVDITFSMEEGKQYMLRRLEFIGNTFTRDNVLRREVLLNEGERYNEEYWDLSLLRLNQLGYFEQVKKEDATVNTNEKEGQVDLTLKVQEKGRQQVSFNGGTSGSQGSFFGIDYSTQNLLGYGESLSFGVSAGNQQTSLSFGFSEPYLKGRPISLGFNLFYHNYQFVGQGFGSTQTADDLYNSYGGQSLFSQKTRGASVTLSAPLSYFARRFRMGRFIRLGLQYTYSTTDIEDPAVNRDEDTSNDIIVTFRQSGVKQSTITPTISYNTLNSSLDPTSGQSLTLGASLSGGVLGGAVNTIAPNVEFKLFRPLFAGKEATARPDPGRTRTFGMRALFGHTSAYGGRFDSNSASFIGGAPLSSRFYLGGEDSIRGYNVRSIAPLIPVERTVNTRNVYVTDLDGNRLKVRDRDRATSNSVAPSVIALFTQNNVSVSDTSYVPVGSDTQLLLNFEYRIPLVGPVTFAPFLDVGSTFNLRKLEDQFIYSEYVTTNLNSGLTVILNPIGILATERQLRNSGLPESAGAVLPPGFRYVNVNGEQQTNTKLGLSQSLGGLFENYRYSLGGELRVQVPVINVPFRLIFAWNPNARVNNAYVFEEKRAIRFSIGRTF